MDLTAILERDRAFALKLSQQAGIKQTHKILRNAERELSKQLESMTQFDEDGREVFSATRAKTTLRQLGQVMRSLTDEMEGVVVSNGKLAAEHSADATLRYLTNADRQYRGVTQGLALNNARVMSRAVSGTESSLLNRLQGDGEAGPGILERYGDNVIRGFETKLQAHVLAKTPWDLVRLDLIKGSPFLQSAPLHWAERIVRTELMFASNRSNWESLREIDDAVGGTMIKILVATFDHRTGADSYAVHGQIRRPNEPFDDWRHSYQHPPNRPNDRETVVPHNALWPIPPGLRPKSDAEVAARWVYDGRRGSPPPRPKMSTVNLAKLAQQAAKPEQKGVSQAAPEPAPKPPKIRAPKAVRLPAIPMPVMGKRRALREKKAAKRNARESRAADEQARALAVQAREAEARQNKVQALRLRMREREQRAKALAAKMLSLKTEVAATLKRAAAEQAKAEKIRARLRRTVKSRAK